jgi:hypothetical protein
VPGLLARLLRKSKLRTGASAARASFDVLIGGVAQNGQAAAREPHMTHAALRARLVRTAMQHSVIVDDCDLALLQRPLFWYRGSEK